MMFINLFALFNVVAVAPVFAQTVAYRVNIQPLTSVLNLPATGFATIFTDAATMNVGYAGIVTKLESNLLASTCNATNGCGVHIHSGKSCNSTATQGGHYYNNMTVPIDPWIDERYSSNANGKANFQAIVQMGTIDIEGRVFVGTSIHADTILVSTKRAAVADPRSSILTLTDISPCILISLLRYC